MHKIPRHQILGFRKQPKIGTRITWIDNWIMKFVARTPETPQWDSLLGFSRWRNQVFRPQSTTRRICPNAQSGIANVIHDKKQRCMRECVCNTSEFWKFVIPIFLISISKFRFGFSSLYLLSRYGFCFRKYYARSLSRLACSLGDLGWVRFGFNSRRKMNMRGFRQI